MRSNYLFKVVIIGVFTLLYSLNLSAQTVRNILIMTPWMAEPGTKTMVDDLQKSAKKQGWKTKIVTNSNGLVSTLNNAAITHHLPDAIVINVNTKDIIKALKVAKQLNVPVFGLDSNASPYLASNVTSNSYTMATKTASYLVDHLPANKKSNVIMITFDGYPPVQKRGVVARAIFNNSPNVNIVSTIQPDMKVGAVKSTEQQIAKLLKTSKPGTISAIWAAWDQPALAAVDVINKLNKKNQDIIVVGIDGTKKALAQINSHQGVQATVVQNFGAMAQKIIELIKLESSKKIEFSSNYYIPAKLVTTKISS
ncbi:substrate-binding domain-containing protein [Piscirickettsia litoralis]|uniref:Periplasmic binding protein domain-containing protein n=1 Tax=Piscirickettsia litoralis TaxID=1891921 RepID=A0ABX2ZYR1_9GAMM|nr:substrate-binding domain-containing protein [Piscirickettsia litoralis]ODN41757.1 hypothetical protein BGC07_00615 [Piscirickettsia litoralis]